MQAKNQACINLIGWIRIGRRASLSVRLSDPGCRYWRRIHWPLSLHHRSLSLLRLRPVIRICGFAEGVHPLPGFLRLFLHRLLSRLF